MIARSMPASCGRREIHGRRAAPGDNGGMASTVFALLLLAPSTKEWSKAHDLAIDVPRSWTILKRDDGAKAFVLEGPVLGNGKPRLVVWNMGEPGRRSLDDIARSFDEQIRKRAGWKRTAFADHEAGPWKAKRLGYSFTDETGSRGRARVSVILFGGKVFVLEMSGASSGFPGTTFDRVEKSLEARWTKVDLQGAKARVPPGWRVLETENGVRAAGPRDALVVLQRDGGERPPGVERDGELAFLGENRPVFAVTREMKGEKIRLRWLHHEGWTGVVILPEEAWGEVGPAARAILASLELPPSRGGDED